MIGIGGSGMRGLAFILKSQGKNVLGVDQDYNKDKAMKDLAESDMIIYSDAVGVDHPLRRRARETKIPELAYHQALGELAAEYTTVAVAGTHGKSSTTAMLAQIMIHAGLDPTVLVGASVPAWEGQNARVGKSKYLVVEADEYRDHFLLLKPEHAIITSIDFDHPDYFSSFDEVKKSFEKFQQQVSGSVITSRDLADDFVTGKHMEYNAALAVAMAEKLGVNRDKAEEALESWRGLGRRMEELGRIRELNVISDYGHHPREIFTTLAAAREKYAGKRILVLYEAHTLERLEVFEKDFLDALSTADGVLLVPVFMPIGRGQKKQAAREKLIKFEQLLLNKSVPVWRIDDLDGLDKVLRGLGKRFDVALAFTAGNLDSCLRLLTGLIV